MTQVNIVACILEAWKCDAETVGDKCTKTLGVKCGMIGHQTFEV